MTGGALPHQAFRTRFELKVFLKLKENLKSLLSFEKRCVREHQASAAARWVLPSRNGHDFSGRRTARLNASVCDARRGAASFGRADRQGRSGSARSWCVRPQSYA
jgi:hypothetical protein